MSLRSQGVRFARAYVISRQRPFVGESSRSMGCLYLPKSSPSVSASRLLEDGLCRLRHFSTKPAQSEASSSHHEGETPPSNSADTSDDQPLGDDTPDDKVMELEKQVKDLKDNLLRSLAEQENTRRIAKRDVEQARSFAISSFAKSLLDTSDNLSRALDAVPEDLRHDHENHPVLATLYEGITMTDDGLTKAFAKNGLKKFGEVGEKFDPNKHEALFEYPDPKGEPGNIGQVMKVGFMLNDRVIRPAEVGVVKSPRAN